MTSKSDLRWVGSCHTHVFMVTENGKTERRLAIKLGSRFYILLVGDAPVSFVPINSDISTKTCPQENSGQGKSSDRTETQELSSSFVGGAATQEVQDETSNAGCVGRGDPS